MRVAGAGNQPETTGLVRGIRRWDLVALTINGIVGAGILGLPSRVFALTGSWSILAFLVCGCFAGLNVLCYAEVGSRFTQTGGAYWYARSAFGPVVGFEVGWLDWLSSLASTAAVCTLFVSYLGYFWPSVESGPGRAAVVTAVVTSLAAINILGVRDTAIVNNFITIGKLTPLIVFVAVGLFFITPGSYSFARVPGQGEFSKAVLLLLFAFSGFGTAVTPAGEMRDPRRDIPFALGVTMVMVTALYVLIQVVCIGTLPNLAGSHRPVADAASRFLGSFGGRMVALTAVIAVLGVLNTLMLATPRLPFAMALGGELPRALAAVQPRFHTPYVSIAVSAAVVLALTLSGTFLYAVTLNAISSLLVLITTCAALPVLRLKANQPPARFVVPGGWLVSAASLALCVWLLWNIPAREARDVAIAASLGLLIFLVRSRRDPGLGVTRRPGGGGGSRDPG